MKEGGSQDRRGRIKQRLTDVDVQRQDGQMLLVIQTHPEPGPDLQL